MDDKKIESWIQRSIKDRIDLEETYVFLFGSRVFRKSRPISDFDVGLYKGKKIPLLTLAQIKDDLENYPIAVNVDLVDFSRVSPEFKRIALKNIKIWNKPKKNLKLI